MDLTGSLSCLLIFPLCSGGLTDGHTTHLGALQVQMHPAPEDGAAMKSECPGEVDLLTHHKKW